MNLVDRVSAPSGKFVSATDAHDFLATVESSSIDLFVIDPPYFEIVRDSWDNQWGSENEYVTWLTDLLRTAADRLAPTGSLLMFGGVGRHGSHPLFRVMSAVEQHTFLQYRNFITWKKRRAYGKSHDYLFCREEIVWYSRSPERTAVTFNIPLTDTLRGYAGFDPKYPAKSEYKRVSNVWDDIPELFRPQRYAQKPIALIDRIVETHSNPGDMVSDVFCGYGTTGMSAIRLGRRFCGCEAIPIDAAAADERCRAALRSRGSACETGRTAKVTHELSRPG